MGESAKLHTPGKWQSQDLNPGILAVDPLPVIAKLNQPRPTGKLSVLPREPCSGVTRQGGLGFCVGDHLATTPHTGHEGVALSVIYEPADPRSRPCHVLRRSQAR